MKISSSRLLFSLVIIVICFLPQKFAYAAELDDTTGKLKAASSSFMYGFEPEQSQPGIIITNEQGEQLAASTYQNSISYNEMGIEGNNALKFSASWHEAKISLSPLSNTFNGKRVEVRLWTLTKGIKINAQLLWENNGNQLSAMHLNPTGRITDDGWRELTSGPLDFNLSSGVSLGSLKLVNDQLEFPMSGQVIDPTLSSLVDAIEVIELGAAQISGQMCRAPTEKEQCGEQGSCFIGRCVDSAFLWGQLPEASIASQAIDHRIYQIEIAEGVRKPRPTFESFKQTMLDLKQSEDGQAFWQGQQDALQLLEDGHLETPKAAQPNIPNVGFCINAGQADLLPNLDNPILPMVFNDSKLVNGVALMAGDVITTIDGLAPEEWIKIIRSPYNIAPGDEASRLVFQYHSLNQLLAQAGALVEFKRCDIEGGCSTNQVETFEVDFSEIIGSPYWRGEFSSWMFDNGFCDFRFDEGSPIQISDSEFSRQITSQESESITEIQFNGFHHPVTEPEWEAGFVNALASTPSNILIDHRFGFGGSPKGLHYVLDNFIGNEDYKTTATISWHGTLDDSTHIQSALDCNQSLTSIYECGWLWRFNQGDFLVDADTHNSKLAVVYGWGLSASDFMLRILSERSAETRTFGISTLPGGYGTTSFLPNLLNEFRGGRIQIQDGMFEFQQWTNFESGFGATPQQIVFQKQSDAIKGVDSIILAARTWLQSSNTGE